MSYETSRKSIQNFFNSNFTALASSRIAWDNVQFDVPTDGLPWIRFSIFNTASKYVSIGTNRLTRRQGVIIIQIFVPEDSTTLQLTQIIDNIVNIFETKVLTGVTFYSPDVNELGVNSSWFQTNVNIDFYFDNITAIG